MGSARKIWQEFKNKVPSFENSKNFKSDVGPQLDTVEATFDKVFAEMKKVESTLDDLEKQVKSLAAAFKGYKAVAQDLEKADDAAFQKHKSTFGNAQIKIQSLIENLTVGSSGNLNVRIKQIAKMLD